MGNYPSLPGHIFRGLFYDKSRKLQCVIHERAAGKVLGLSYSAPAQKGPASGALTSLSVSITLFFPRLNGIFHFVGSLASLSLLGMRHGNSILDTLACTENRRKM
jgi:hypothetical protein